MLGGIFQFNSNSQANREEPIRTQHFVASDLDIHCLLMPRKNDVRLVFQYFTSSISLSTTVQMYMLVQYGLWVCTEDNPRAFASGLCLNTVAQKI